MKETLGYFHPGSVPNAETKEALGNQGHRVMSRDFDYFNPRDVEDFDVVVGDGVDMAALKAVYPDAVTAEEFLGAMAEKKAGKPKAEKKAEKPFDPDAPAKGREPQKQG